MSKTKAVVRDRGLQETRVERDSWRRLFTILKNEKEARVREREAKEREKENESMGMGMGMGMEGIVNDVDVGSGGESAPTPNTAMFTDVIAEMMNNMTQAVDEHVEEHGEEQQSSFDIGNMPIDSSREGSEEGA